MSKRDEILPLFPLRIRELLSAADVDFSGLREIRLRVNQPVILRSGLGEEEFLYRKDENRMVWDKMVRGGESTTKTPYLVTPQDVRDTVELISRHSLYAFEEDVKRGFLTVPGGHRVGIAGKVVMDGGKVAVLRNISFLNIRISHEVQGCAVELLPYIIRENMTEEDTVRKSGMDDRMNRGVMRDGLSAKMAVGKIPCYCGQKREQEGTNLKEASGAGTDKKMSGDICHTLILSGPGGGKTTLLRDLVRLLSYAGKNVSVIDERSEIAGCYQGIPGNDLGPRTDVLDGCPKAVGCYMALRSLAPDVLAVDELGGREDLEALSEVTACGCRILATMHADGLEDLLAKPFFKALWERRTFERFLVRDPAVPVGLKKAWRVADENGVWMA